MEHVAGTFLKGSAKLMQQLNTSLVLEVIREKGPISRSELARLTELSNPAVSALLEPLLRDGVVREIGTDASTGGRPARLLAFNARAGCLVGIDVGGTTIVGAVVDLAGNILNSMSCPSARGEQSVNIVLDLIEELIKSACVPQDALWGIGVGIPGVTDVDGQRVTHAPAVGWDDVHIGRIIRDRFGVPFFADNDVNCFARGELWRGMLKGVTNGVAIAVGTGVGVGLIIDGRVYQGTHNAAGEVGYWLLGSLGPIEKPTGFGPLESIAAGPGIAGQARRDLEADAQLAPRLRDMVGGDLSKITAREVFEAALLRDEYCEKLVEQTTAYLGILTANIASLLDVEKVVIGGGLSRAGNQLLVPIRNIVETLCPYPPQIELSTLREDAAILGAVSGVLNLRETSINFLQVHWEDQD